MQKIDLSILPQGGINPVIRCSQGDVGRQFQVELYNEDMSAKYILDGTETLTVEGHKPDGNFFSFDLPATTGSVITVTTTEQMTACYGDVYGEIRIEKGSILLGTANFTLAVEIGASAEDTVSISALQFIDALRNEMHQAVEDTEDARDDAIDAKTGAENARDASQGYANDSSDYADASKAWAVGPSGSGSGSDTNNAKYYSQQASTSATNAESAKNDAVSAKDTAVYAKNQAISAKDDALQAKTDAISAKDDAIQAKTDAQTAKADAVQAKTDAVSAKTAAQSAQAGAELAQQKIENMTASASGLPAGSNPTVSKTEVGGVVNLGFGIPKGDKGDKGDTGNDGVSPSASVTQTDPDTVTFTVTDGQGTTTATLPAGGAPALAGLSDVNLTTPSDKQALVYDGNTSKWVNGQAGVPELYPYGDRTITAGKISGYNSSSESIIETFNPVTNIIATDNIHWFIGMPIVFIIDNNNDNIHYKCELVDYRVRLRIDNNSYETNNPAYCLHHIAETVASGEEGLAYDFELYFLIPDNTSRLVKVAISYDSYGNMTSHTTTYVSSSGGGANESLVDWSQTNACRWRVSRFWDVQSALGVELELNSVLDMYEGETNAQFGSQLVQDPMHYGNTYQSIIIDIPLSNLVSVYNEQNVDVLVEGNTYTFDLYNDFADDSYYPATLSFNPGTYDWFDPNTFPPQSVLTRDVVVAGCTISKDIYEIVFVRVGLWIRTAQRITTFADLCTALGISSGGGRLGHFTGVICLSKSKS